MLYTFFRPLAGLTIRIFFPKIYLVNTESIPAGKPVLLVSNHPTTFTEPCVLACFLSRPLYYLVRGDFFENPVFSFLLRDLHMMPIYRQRDGGYKNLKNNFGTIDSTYKWLSEDKMVMILAEGTAIYEKRLRPLRKGAARIALHALKEDPEMELYIVPVGVNYTDSLEFGTQIMVNFDAPFQASDYFGPDKGPKGKAINAFTQHLTERMKANIITIDDPADDWLFDQLLELLRNDWDMQTPYGIHDHKGPFQREKQLTLLLNEMDHEQKAAIKREVKDYFVPISLERISDFVVKHRNVGWGHTLFIVLGFIPYLLGWFLHLPPRLGVFYVAETKVIFNEFFGSVRLAAWLILVLIYYFVLILVGTIGWGWIGLAGFLVFPILGYFAVIYERRLNKMKAYWRFSKLSKDKQQGFVEKRQKLSDWIGNLMIR